ncbi:hypothetical protein GCM10025789_24050 [Tessaracoccus lubricantis]|uniref:Uncharacterized protein n=1 Tax=Tessaracoccus lubricantis TaxID=545543 RepID=A0ABP9FM10_9ACTN
MKRVGLWAFVVAGIAIVAWAVASWVSPTMMCRGVEMGPGDTCEYSSRTDEHTGQVQTYEERVAVARSQAPFAVATGLGMAAFGGWLLRQDVVAARAAKGSEARAGLRD